MSLSDASAPLTTIFLGKRIVINIDINGNFLLLRGYQRGALGVTPALMLVSLALPNTNHERSRTFPNVPERIRDSLSV